MKHSINDLEAKIKVMYEKVVALKTTTNSPYGKPHPSVVQYAIDDIQAMAREIANDIDRPKPQVGSRAEDE